jgi:predicted flavoprotein YhiN
VELRMAERSGQVFPPQENSEAVLRRLQSAVHAVKGTVHRTK